MVKEGLLFVTVKLEKFNSSFQWLLYTKIPVHIFRSTGSGSSEPEQVKPERTIQIIQPAEVGEKNQRNINHISSSGTFLSTTTQSEKLLTLLMTHAG